MAAIHRTCPLALALLLCTGFALTAGEKKPGSAVPKKDPAAAVRKQADALIHELERTQADLALHYLNFTRPQEQELYKLSALVLAEVRRFEDDLNKTKESDALLKRYQELDGKLQKFLVALRAAGPEQRGLTRAADYIGSANEELFYALAMSGEGPHYDGPVMLRQAQAFGRAVKDLERAAKVSLGAKLDQAVLQDEIAKLGVAAERFEKGLQSKSTENERRDQFKPVDQAWDKVVQTFSLLPPDQNVFLLRSAARVDGLHERMYRLLGITGKRPHLSIRS